MERYPNLATLTWNLFNFCTFLIAALALHITISFSSFRSSYVWATILFDFTVSSQFSCYRTGKQNKSRITVSFDTENNQVVIAYHVFVAIYWCLRFACCNKLQKLKIFQRIVFKSISYLIKRWAQETLRRHNICLVNYH